MTSEMTLLTISFYITIHILDFFNNLILVKSSSTYQFMISPDHVCGTSPLIVHTDTLNDMRCVRACTKNVLCTFTHYCTIDDTCTLFTSLDDCSNSGSALCADGSKPLKATLNDVSHIVAPSPPFGSSYPTSTPLASSTSTSSAVMASSTLTLTESSSTATTSIPNTSPTTVASTSTQGTTTLQPAEELTWTFGYEFQSATYTLVNSIADIITHVRDGAEIRIVLTFNASPDDAIIFTPDTMYTAFGGTELCAYFHHTLSRDGDTGFSPIQPPEHWLLSVCGTRLQQQKWAMMSNQDMQAPIFPAFVAKWFYRKSSAQLVTVFEALTIGSLPDFENLKVQMEKGYTFQVELNNQHFFTSKSHHFTATDACGQSIWDTSVNAVDGLMDVENLWKIRQVCSSGTISVLDIPIATTNQSSVKSEVMFKSMKWKVNDYWELVYKRNTLDGDISGSYAQLDAAFSMGRKIRIKTSNFSGDAFTLYKSGGAISAVVANYFNPAQNESLLSDKHSYRKYFIFSSSGDISVMNINVFDESVAYTDTYSTTNEDISWYADRDHWSVAYSSSESDNQKVLDAVHAGSDVTCLCDFPDDAILMYPDAVFTNDNSKTIIAVGVQSPMVDRASPGVYNFRLEGFIMVHTFQALFERYWLQNNIWNKGGPNVQSAFLTGVCVWNIN